MVQVRARGTRRSGDCDRVATAALRLEDRQAVEARDRGRLGEALCSRVGRDEGRHVVDLVSADDIGRHVRLQPVEARSGRVLAGIPDLPGDDVRDRALLVALQTSLRERVVEVRSDRPGRSGRRECVAARALLLEELLPGVLVTLRHETSCTTARQEERCPNQQQRRAQATRAAGSRTHSASTRLRHASGRS